MAQDRLQDRLQNWFMRSTKKSGFRRLGDTPLGIATDIGLKRDENQDRAAVMRLQTSRGVFAIALVADGMGGMREGALCASITTSAFISACVRMRELPLDQRMYSAAHYANELVFAAFRGRGGSTLSAIGVDETGNAFAVNVGDSRLYCLKGNDLHLLTVDDTLAAHVDRGAAVNRNELVQYIGVGSDLEVHLLDLPLSTIDLFVLTSDGAHSLDQRVMADIVFHAKEAGAAASRLVDVAYWCGGKDNASAIATTNIYSLLYIEENFDPGIIEIWDAFGDLQIVGVDREVVAPQRAKIEEAKRTQAKKAAEPAALPKHGDLKKSNIKKKKKKAAKAKPKRGSFSRTSFEVVGDDHGYVKPQLKIDFDESGGNDENSS